MEKVKIIDLGIVDYKMAWDYQTRLQKKLIKTKLDNRDTSEDDRIEQEHYLIVCQHPPVLTMGKSGKEEHLLSSPEQLKNDGIAYYDINRGGDITYHGPGQLVVYPIFDLDRFFTDVHKYVRYLEQVVIDTLSSFGLVGDRVEGLTGVWIKGETQMPDRKLCAIGVHLSRWVTMHGLALNVSTNLDHFQHIVPCGIGMNSKSISSMSKELEKEIDLGDVQDKLISNFAKQFKFVPIYNVDITI